MYCFPFIWGGINISISSLLMIGSIYGILLFQISNGAEVLMLEKEIFLKHANESVKANIRKLIQPYPPTDDMQSKLQNVSDWKCWKDELMNDIYQQTTKKTIRN